MMAGLETRLKTISVLNTAAFVAGQITPPMAVISVPDIPKYHETMQRGYFELDIFFDILVSNVLDQKSQNDLSAFADITGSNSVIAAIYGDKTLNGTVDDCQLLSFRQLTNEEVGVIGYRGGRFTLRVAARAS